MSRREQTLNPQSPVCTESGTRDPGRGMRINERVIDGREEETETIMRNYVWGNTWLVCLFTF